MRLSRPIREVVFAGNRSLGAAALHIFRQSCAVTGQKVIGVVAVKPDPAKHWWADESRRDVWHEAEAMGIPLFRQADLVHLEYDLLFSVYWHRVFPPPILKRAALNVNLHTAPLPECRGRYSCSMAIIKGDQEFGPTLHLMDPLVDTGAIIAEQRFLIANTDTARTIYDKTNRASIGFLQRWIPKVLAGDFQVREQDDIAATTSRPIRTFGADALQPYLSTPARRLDRVAADVVRRALTFPPRYAPPPWLDGDLQSGAT